MADGVTSLLAVRGLAKRYPGVVALKGVDLSGNAGEVHALVGANGAGKSTFMNLISGAATPSAGAILIDGKPVHFSSPAAALELGIATVYQEFSLVPDLSVARNIFLGREPRGSWGLVDEPLLLERTRALLDRYSLSLDPTAEVSGLSVAEQQLVEVARALSFAARIVILDEPTAVLSLAEQQNLFAIIRRLRGEGLLILYVSHHLKEVLVIADRVSVIRDGEMIATRDASSLTVDELADLMIGRSGAYARGPDAAAVADGPTFAVTYRTGGRPGRLRVSGGEIVGLAGLVGAGRTTFARALAGNGSTTASVAIEVDGQAVRVGSPREAMREGIVYLTEDRKRDGIFARLDIVANATAAALPRMSTGPLRNARRERRRSSEILGRLRLVAASLNDPIVKLSGGNQQKVVIGRALLTEPRLLVCDEPTRGVDVGAKAEIHQILRELARGGVAILVVSSEIEEILAVAHRIVVMHDREFVADIPAGDADEAGILIAASGTPEQRGR
jgi:ABC-type sugar transport system ATPase subunit